ncbi:MAG TPA: DNA cytosine methyltransferase [Candidatus Aphodousia faecalis]|nr:DNA cytosine methyltransferase [Candidatus Aphodousia faecalis]
MSVYYNEFDPFAAQWLRELIKCGFIADGVVDDRSITEVKADDLKEFTQCHFFAGIGGWSYALRLAGVSDGARLWTGSCPCQSFSVAGKQKGFDDERHLWPVFSKLIDECKPSIVFGEQVETAIKHGWLDLVQDDLESYGYACASAVLPAACVGAPHIRHRLYWGGVLSDANSNGLNREKVQQLRLTSSGSSSSNGDSQGIRLERKAVNEVSVRPEGWEAERRQTCQSGPFNQQLANPDSFGCRGRYSQSRLRTPTERFPINGEEQLFSRFNFWSGAEWRLGQDGKIRPVEPGTFPLAYGIPARVGRLRGYGNAIVPQVAAEFIKAFLGAKNDMALERQRA